MKLPKCPHCEKLMIGVISTDQGFSREMAVYLCPEKLTRKEPEWVEVLEV